jgi:membrane protein
VKIWKWSLLAASAVAIGAFAHPDSKPTARAVEAVTRATRPKRSRSLLIRLYQDIVANRLFAVAAGVGFYALLALVPALSVAVSLFGMFVDRQQIAGLPELLSTFLPADAVTLVHREAERLAAQPAQALSLKLAVGLAISVWGASAAVRAAFDALNVIDEQQETRSPLRLYGTALLVTVDGVAVFLLALAMIGANPSFVALGAISSETLWLYELLRWPFFFLVSVVALTTLYWVGPSRPPARFLALAPGAAAASLLWAAGSSLFGWYVSALGNYTAAYGSLATVVVIMTWLWLSAAIMLVGAQINYELTHPR